MTLESHKSIVPRAVYNRLMDEVGHLQAKGVATSQQRGALPLSRALCFQATQDDVLGNLASDWTAVVTVLLPIDCAKDHWTEIFPAHKQAYPCPYLCSVPAIPVLGVDV